MVMLSSVAGEDVQVIRNTRIIAETETVLVFVQELSQLTIFPRQCTQRTMLSRTIKCVQSLLNLLKSEEELGVYHFAISLYILTTA